MKQFAERLVCCHMSYDIDFRVKVEGAENLYASVFDCEANITWNLGEMIRKSTGLEWNNEQNNGLVKDVISFIEHGLEELELHPEQYRQYEAPNGWGTIAGCKHFFNSVLRDWRRFKTYCYPDELQDYVTFWIV